MNPIISAHRSSASTNNKTPVAPPHTEHPPTKSALSNKVIFQKVLPANSPKTKTPLVVGLEALGTSLGQVLKTSNTQFVESPTP